VEGRHAIVAAAVDDAIEIISQREEPGCWLFEARLDGAVHRLRLAWPDYDLFAPGGETPPERVAEAVLRFLRSRPEFTPLPGRLDASWGRRKVEGADRMIAAMLGGGGGG
jgi:hypothetical protein